jgi:hypothetical protein
MNELVSASQEQEHEQAEAPSRRSQIRDGLFSALLRAGAAHVDVLDFVRVVAPLRTTI